MTLKHRLKKIEAKLDPSKKFKVWVAHSQKEVEEIAAGKRQHPDGTFYDGELIYMIDRIITDKLPKGYQARDDQDHPLDFGENDTTEEDTRPDEGTLPDDDIKARISALKQRKEDLERMIEEGEN